MPRIDTVDFKKGKFKKTEVRSWDSNLLDSLVIKKDPPENHSVKNKEKNAEHAPLITKDIENLPNENILPDKEMPSFSEEVDKNTIRVQDKSSNRGQSDSEILNKFKSHNAKGVVLPSKSPIDRRADVSFSASEHGVINNLNSVRFLDEEFQFRKLMTRLAGNEKRVLILIVTICNRRESIKTGSIASEDFDNYLCISRNSRETAIKRLCKKGLIRRNTGKRGVRGMLNLGISEKALAVANQLISSSELSMHEA